jgi:MFS transporter, DHA1 family, multidrug resistance protein
MLDKKALGVLFCTLFLLMLSVGIIIPNIAYRAQELSAGALQISLLFALYSLMQFLFAPVWGHLSDRVGRKPVLLLGLLGNGLGLLLFGVSERLPWLYAARGLSGLMSSAALPTAMAYVADVTDETHRGRGMGLMGAAMGLGFIFGPGIGGALSSLGHGAPFLIAGTLNLATCAAAALLLRESLACGEPGQPAPFFPSPGRALRSPLLPFYVIAFFVPFAMAALETTFPLLIQDRFGYGARDMGLMFLFMGSAVFLVQGFLLGRWIQAMGEENVLTAGLLINAAGFLLVIAAAGRASLTAALVVGGVGNQVMRPTNASLITKRATLGRGASIGIMDSFDSLGRILGPILAGALYRPDPRYPYIVSAAVLAMVGLALSLWRRAAARGGAPDVTAAGGV